jgi:hypothetical protein
MMVFFWEDERPELPEPALSPFRLGESVAVGLLEADALLVMTRDMVLLPLTVTMVVVMTGADALEAAAVVVIKAVLLTGSFDSGVEVGGLLVGVGVGVVDCFSSSCVVVCGADDVGAATEVGAREEVVAGAVCDSVSEADSTAELEVAADDEPPVPTGLLWPWRLCR